jgi:16S rRNA (guanine527-N7)-methyltransferase
LPIALRFLYTYTKSVIDLDSEHHILFDGLLQLCKNSVVNNIIAPRREEITRLLHKYITEVELFNPALGLVGSCDRRELVVKHILDSLAPLAVLMQYLGRYTEKPMIADVGSGAGLPGIPLAIVLPNMEFTLIERMGRRAGFLRNTQAALGLSNVSVEEAEMEKTCGRFDMVTFRAFRPLAPDILKALFRLCATGGILAAYKGRREKTENEIAALEKLQPNLAGRWNITPCPVPLLNEERHLLLISK